MKEINVINSNRLNSVKNFLFLLKILGQVPIIYILYYKVYIHENSRQILKIKISSDFQAGVYVDNLQGDFNKSSEHVSIK